MKIKLSIITTIFLTLLMSFSVFAAGNYIKDDANVCENKPKFNVQAIIDSLKISHQFNDRFPNDGILQVPQETRPLFLQVNKEQQIQESSRHASVSAPAVSGTGLSWRG